MNIFLHSNWTCGQGDTVIPWYRASLWDWIFNICQAAIYVEMYLSLFPKFLYPLLSFHTAPQNFLKAQGSL